MVVGCRRGVMGKFVDNEAKDCYFYFSLIIIVMLVENISIKVLDCMYVFIVI